MGIVDQMRKALTKSKIDRLVTVSHKEFSRARDILIDRVMCDRMGGKRVWSSEKNASVENKAPVLPPHIEIQAYKVNRQSKSENPQRIVWLMIIHPVLNEPESRMIRTQEARLIITSLDNSPVGRIPSRALYVLSARADDCRWCTPIAQKLLQYHVSKDIVPCTTEDMLFDITEHHLCPQSRRLSPDETKELCLRLRCPDTHSDRVRVFPHLKRSDPVCKMCGYFEQDLVAFDRGTHMYWRVVV